MGKVVPLKSKQPPPTKEKDQDKKYYSSEELIKQSTVNFHGAITNKNKLEVTLNMLMNLMPIAEGLYRVKPSQGNSYALSNLVSQMKDIMQQLDNTVDFEELAESIYEVVFVPIIEEIIKALGKTLKDFQSEMDSELKVKERKVLDKEVKNMYRKFAHEMETKSKETKDKLLTSILANV